MAKKFRLTALIAVLAIFLMSMVSCYSLGSSYSDYSARLEEEEQTERNDFYQWVKNKFFPEMTNDEICNYLEVNRSVLLKDWKISFFVDSFGDATNEAYFWNYSYGNFSNSATRGDELGILLLFSSTLYIELFEYNDNQVYDEITVQAKTKDGTVQNLAFNSGKYGRIVSRISSILNVLMNSQDSFVKFHAEDNYYSQYSWTSNFKNLPILVCAVWMHNGLLEDYGWFDALR